MMIPDSQPSRASKFPAVHDDELLYSIVARYGVLAGNIDAQSTNLDLFGRAFGHAGTHLPANLQSMADRLPASLTLSGRDLVLRHTLLPYQCAFLPHEAMERTIAAALADGGRRGRPAGSADRPLPRPRNLRFCYPCVEQMLRDRQDLHWKRVHQLAVVTVCPKHECDLLESAVSPGPHDTRLHPPTLAVCDAGQPSVIPSGTNMDRAALAELARDAAMLLRGEYPAGLERRSGPDYAQMFRDLGYGGRARLDWTIMEPAIRTALADISPAMPGVTSAANRRRGWFVELMSERHPGHTDRVLIAAFVLRRIESVAPRFWAALDEITGRPLLLLKDVA